MEVKNTTTENADLYRSLFATPVGVESSVAIVCANIQ
jgi:hypothetical protein